MVGSTFIVLLTLALAAIAGMVIVYGQKYTLPGYQGKGNWGLLIGTGLAGIAAFWLIGRSLGIGNLYTATADILAFSLAGSGLLVAGAWMALLGLLAVLAVAIVQTVRYGRAWM